MVLLSQNTNMKFTETLYKINLIRKVTKSLRNSNSIYSEAITVPKYQVARRLSTLPLLNLEMLYDQLIINRDLCQLEAEIKQTFTRDIYSGL